MEKVHADAAARDQQRKEEMAALKNAKLEPNLSERRVSSYP